MSDIIFGSIDKVNYNLFSCIQIFVSLFFLSAHVNTTFKHIILIMCKVQPSR